MSSNWRRFDADGPGSVWTHQTYGSVRNPLPKFLPMLGGFFLECLPAVRHVPKAAVAESWLAVRKDVESYAALDDMCEWEGYTTSEAFQGRYVQTDPETGLTDADCVKALAMLNTPAA